jgi:hypothetical protein
MEQLKEWNLALMERAKTLEELGLRVWIWM